MVGATPESSPSVSARVPASTVRAVRRFFHHERGFWAALFQVHERTVMRWEKRGALLSALPLDTTAQRDPDWRPKLLLWMVDQYEKRGVSDNRPKEGNPTCSTTSTAT